VLGILSKGPKVLRPGKGNRHISCKTSLYAQHKKKHRLRLTAPTSFSKTDLIKN